MMFENVLPTILTQVKDCWEYYNTEAILDLRSENAIVISVLHGGYE